MNEGRCWNSIWTASGISEFASSAVLRAAYSVLPLPLLMYSTWIAVWDALNALTWSSMPGTHDQNVMFTGS